MCGLGVILRTDGGPIPDAWLDRLDARLTPRGPDGAGRFRDEITTADGVSHRIALVHRRLAVIDPADGHQPMVSERGRSDAEGLVAVVFNGCIYNHPELRDELVAAGHAFVTDHCDTEVLVHGWREWGESLPEHLEGMYAFVIWDRVAARTFAAADPFGQKPLYVADGASFRVLTSDAASSNAIAIELGGVSDVTLRPATVTKYLLSGYDEDARSIDYPATRTARLIGTAQRERLMDATDPTFASMTDEALDDAFETRLDRAVQRRLDADVPLGCFLSGGVDSSLIAALAKRHQPDLRTFCVRMPDPRYDESDHAARVAEHLGTDHTTLEVAPDPGADLVHLVRTMGQPFGDSSILPTYWVSRAAREHVTVVLSGDAGDELFLGYQRYQVARLLARHHGWLRRLPLAGFRRAHPKSRRNKAARLTTMARDYPRLGERVLSAISSIEDVRRLLGDGTALPERAAVSGVDAVDRARRWEVQTYLPQDLLVKVDVASMAVALEVRCPFLDREVASMALAVSPDRLMPGGERKGLLRRIARRHVPDAIADRPKMGFAVPLGAWFREDYGGMRSLLESYLGADADFGPFDLDRRAARSLVDEHLAGVAHHEHRLFALLTLAIWARHVHES